MKAIGILGSPRREGNCSKMLTACLEELSTAGFETDLIYLQEKKIRYCLGCGTCLSEGECLLKDEMIELREELRKANALILASPVYFFNVSAQMKCFIDRMVAFGHRPRLKGYGGAIVSYAGVGDPELVANYLSRVLKTWGIWPVGYAIGFGVLPGEVKREDLDRARDLGKRISNAFKENLRPEIKEEDIVLRNQLIKLITNYKEYMKADYEFWKSKI
ncbi:MAG: flavodoxin family protein [Archaeoglobaceae archaeon]|nr:flavodoxin family protein [Archaeoglobaceae archaeon]MDW8128079.1 flavodoxin family protein [Archaeoglobaceae archaeon]